MAKIVFTGGSYRGHEIKISEGEITLGRGHNCSLTIPDGRISSQHALLRKDDGHWWVYDLESTNGTLVNGQRITGTRLNDGDRVEIGENVFLFHMDDSAVVAQPAAPGGAAKPALKLDAGGTDRTVVVPAPGRRVERIEDMAKPAADVKAALGTASDDDIQVVKDLNEAYRRMNEQISRVIVGQAEVIDQVLISIFCRGHALLVGVPGVAKTLLVSTLSHVLDLSFKRIQFTPDLMPSDITGTDVLEEDRTTGKRVFRFVKGPIFANLVLADEINRTPPKTQAALLEAMQEHRATIGDKTYFLPEPFFVLATQNPIEQEGTYPLPEAQLDRFMFNIIVDYPKRGEESEIIKQVTGTYKADLDVALTAQDIMRLQQVVRRVPVADHVIEYARDLARATRPKQPEAPDFVKEMVSWGAGPRAGIYLILAAKARAILQGRYHATTEDVREVALPVLRHRVLTTFNAEAAGVKSDDIVRMIIDRMKAADKADV
jgi:MoxR-like ATPase